MKKRLARAWRNIAEPDFSIIVAALVVSGFTALFQADLAWWANILAGIGIWAAAYALQAVLTKI